MNGQIIQKEKKRYKQFRGERVFLVSDEVESFTKASNVDNDAWTEKKNNVLIKMY